MTDIDRIVYHARKPLPAHLKAEADKLAAEFRQFKLAASIEAMVQWAYDEGFKDGECQTPPSTAAPSNPTSGSDCT